MTDFHGSERQSRHDSMGVALVALPQQRRRQDTRPDQRDDSSSFGQTGVGAQRRTNPLLSLPRRRDAVGAGPVRARQDRRATHVRERRRFGAGRWPPRQRGESPDDLRQVPSHRHPRRGDAACVGSPSLPPPGGDVHRDVHVPLQQSEVGRAPWELPRQLAGSRARADDRLRQ